MTEGTKLGFGLSIGTANEFGTVRSAFQDASFDEKTLLSTLKIEDMSDVGSVDLSKVDFSQVPPTCELFIKLFLASRSVPLSEIERLLPAVGREAFFSLGLINTEKNGEGSAPVLVYPVEGFWMASDSQANPDNTNPFLSDPVFPAIYAGTLRFLRLLPGGPAEKSLDLCAGSGIGAFVLSRHSKRAVSADISKRASHFAAFNRDLNNLTNVDVVCGDLYEPVAGQSFDRIVAHPPYVPAITETRVWRDAGATGERVVRQIIEGLPEHLGPNGIFCMQSLGVDTKEGRFEQRARGWLKDRATEFDIIFASFDERTPNEILRDLANLEEEIDREDRQRLRRAFADEGIVRMPKGALVMRRHGPGENHEPITIRTKLSSLTEGSDFQIAFANQRLLSDQSFVESLLNSRPTLAPRLEVKVTHVVHEGELVPAQFICDTDKPFSFSVMVDGWMVGLIARFDGKLSTREIFDKARSNAEMPDDFQLTDFNLLIGKMIEHGFLTLPK